MKLQLMKRLIKKSVSRRQKTQQTEENVGREREILNNLRNYRI